MRLLKSLWRAVIDWLTSGDLVPVLVVASAWHYIKALAPFDPWWSAVAIGFLVDLGHYRTVRLASRYRVSGKSEEALSKSRRQSALRWAIALVMTAISLAYHIYYYGLAYFVLGLPFPVLIAALAYFDQVDKKPRKDESESVQAAATVEAKPQAVADDGSLSQAKMQAFAILQGQPEIKLRELAAAVGRSESQASRYRREWRDKENAR